MFLEKLIDKKMKIKKNIKNLNSKVFLVNKGIINLKLTQNQTFSKKILKFLLYKDMNSHILWNSEFQNKFLEPSHKSPLDKFNKNYN